MPQLTDTTPTVYCQSTNRLIAFCFPPDDPQVVLAQYTPEYGADLTVIPFGEAWTRHNNGAKTEPREITSEQFHEMLGMLPPVAWHETGDGESFKMSERKTGDITNIYVRIDDRHFTFADDIRLPHKDCCDKVRQSRAFYSTPCDAAYPADVGECLDQSPIFDWDNDPEQGATR